MSELKVGDTVLVPATVEHKTPGSVQLRLPGTHGTLGYDKSDVAAWNTRATPPLMPLTESGAQIVGESVSEWRPIADDDPDLQKVKDDETRVLLSRVGTEWVAEGWWFSWSEQWESDASNAEGSDGLPYNPTHWMPLPPPPAPPKEASNGE